MIPQGIQVPGVRTGRGKVGTAPIGVQQKCRFAQVACPAQMKDWPVRPLDAEVSGFAGGVDSGMGDPLMEWLLARVAGSPLSSMQPGNNEAVQAENGCGASSKICQAYMKKADHATLRRSTAERP